MDNAIDEEIASGAVPMLRRLGPPLFAFGLARVLLWAAAKSVGHDAMAAGEWAHWDSDHYLSIAKRGYEFFSCARLPGFDPHQFCGNTGWLPGYPLLIRVLTTVGVTPVLAGALLSGAFALASLVLLWNAFLGPELSIVGALALLLAAFFPGHVYEHAVFPVSLCAFFQIAALRFHASQRFAAAGVAGAAAAFSYSSGVFLAAVLGLHLLLSERERPYREQLGNLALGPGVIALGFAAALAVQRAQAGVWNGYFAVQAKYGFGLHSPLVSLGEHLFLALDEWPHFRGPDHQTVFVAVLVLILVAHAFLARPRARTDSVLSLFVLVYWLVPLVLGGQLSLYRAEAALLPAVPLAMKLRWPWLASLLGASLVLAWLMARLFFENELI